MPDIFDSVRETRAAWWLADQEDTPPTPLSATPWDAFREVKAIVAKPPSTHTQRDLEVLWQAKRDHPWLVLPAWKVPEDDEVESLACIYGVVDTFGTRFNLGCFAEARLSKVRGRWEHDDSYGDVCEITAVWEVVRSELPQVIREAYPKATGGLVCTRRYLDTENGQLAKAWHDAGLIEGISISFHAQKSGLFTTEDGREIIDYQRAELTEITIARRAGAVPGTMPIVGTKHATLLEGRYTR